MKFKIFIYLTLLVFLACQTSEILLPQDRKYIKEIPLTDIDKDKLFGYTLLGIYKKSNKNDLIITVKFQQKDIGKILADIEMHRDLYYVDDWHNQNFANRVWCSMTIDINDNGLKFIFDEFYANYQISYDIDFNYIRKKPVVARNDLESIFIELDNLCNDIQQTINETK